MQGKWGFFLKVGGEMGGRENGDGGEMGMEGKWGWRGNGDGGGMGKEKPRTLGGGGGARQPRATGVQGTKWPG